MDIRHCTTKETKKGITLVEMLVIVSIFTIMMLAIMQSIASFYRFNAYSIAQSYQVEHARRGVELLVRDIREMTYADDGTFPLALMENNRIGFYSDIDRDNSVEYVEYRLSSTTLQKYVYDAAGNPPLYDTTPEQVLTISEYVQNILQATSTFMYFDANGAPAGATSTVTDIKYIEVRIIVNIDPIRDPGEYMLRSSAALRNLKDNF